MIKRFFSLTVIVVWIILVSNISFAQTAFYEGKTIRIIVISPYPSSGTTETFIVAVTSAARRTGTS